jgi:hypothetical protein
MITRRGGSYDARELGVTQIYPCSGARDAAGDPAVQKALARGRYREVKRLRRDAHEITDTCWCHLVSGCLSTCELGT